MSRLTGQFIRFLIIGTLAFLIDYVGFLILTRWAGLYYLWAGFLSFTISLIFNYLLSMRYVFVPKAGLSRFQLILLFIVLSVCGLILSLVLLAVFVEWLLIQDQFAKLIVTGLVMVFNFISRKQFIEQPSVL